MSVEPQQRRGLGRGLSALLGEASREEPVGQQGSSRSPGVQSIAIGAIRPHPGQPRRHFDEAALDELADSLRTRGLLQPIVVRPRGDGYEIVAGERRWRAAQRAQLHEVPVIVRELDDAATLEIAIVENIQRQDLNAIEEAEAYHRLIADYGHTQDALGKLVHKSRSHIANLLRLLDLPAEIRAHVATGALSMGHARALINAPDPVALAAEAIRRDLSVRETENLARAAKPERARRVRVAPVETKGADADVAALERQLGDMLGLKVAISHGIGGGTVAIEYASLDQLDMICQRLSGEPI